MRHDYLSLIVHILLTTSINVSRLAKSIVWDWHPFKFLLGLYLTFVYNHEIQAGLEILSNQNGWLKVFEVLFLFKFIKIVVHTLSFLLYRPYPVSRNPSVTSRDVTVIIPTVGTIDDVEFRETLSTILANSPAEIIVCTVGEKKLCMARRVCAEEVAKATLIRSTPTKIRVIAIETASKRKQLFKALQYVQTSIVALADDHVFWGSRFLIASLAPFEDPQIGGVGTNKQVRRLPFQFSFPNFLNFIACNYLERHNFECTASVYIDQAVFVLSGRTVFYRTAIFRHPRFEKEYCHETWLFGLVGKNGFAVDDDNLLTRFTIGIAKYKVWFQNSPDSTMFTVLGEPDKFFKQMDRWIRTTWRSNSTSLFSDQTPWKTQPWSVYAIYLSSFVNLALFYDIALLTTLHYGLESPHSWPNQCFESINSNWSAPSRTRAREFTLPTPLCVPQLQYPKSANTSLGIEKSTAMLTLVLILFISKMIKPLPHFWRNPRDMLYIPFYILFGYYHSLIKLKALFTVCVISWGSRPGVR
ncbi:nucleotide-diphospho-sugar transferase [Leptodontidium sp. MPI-SDFR-AT-0119]|nr:nucleotide-diphospho-sugar transferase [Leptodontidium sp. MPI-SDFR-AT-0119]